MKDDNVKRMRSNRVWLSEASCDLDAFRPIVERSVSRADYPFARDVLSNVLVYDGLESRAAAASPESRKARFRSRTATIISASSQRRRSGAFPSTSTAYPPC
jgi:hypothetical protein